MHGTTNIKEYKKKDMICLYCLNERQSGWLYWQLLGEMTTKKAVASVKRPNHFDTVFHDFLLFRGK
jgi:hypothetical protein